jgi:hypothetical protein
VCRRPDQPAAAYGAYGSAQIDGEGHPHPASMLQKHHPPFFLLPIAPRSIFWLGVSVLRVMSGIWGASAIIASTD